ncbi:MAG: SusD/RagB family nutrient-binding outer membrane lipoprotein [Bacteroidetes bacterium]|nr:MAG: SusD/RagB family nutrient-binding outer membrane lipoprotein [Bacteroidota bacterium]
MKKYISAFLLVALLFFNACTELVEGINENPNDILISDVDAELFLTGALLANSVAQAGHLNRIAGMYSGQLVGITSLYSNIYGFALSTAESVSTWSRIYVGVVTNLRHIRASAPGDKLLTGIAKVVEAHAIGTAASIFGDVPYSEINNPKISDPVFDSQVSVFNAVIALLDEAIADLSTAPSRPLSADIHFNGDAPSWLAVAYTLKARYYLQLKDYGAAYTAAQNGIKDHSGSLRYIPRGDPNIAEGDKNLFWEILEGSRTGDIGTANSYLMQLLDSTTTFSRNHAKTNEAARRGYYRIDESGGRVNKGIVEQFEPHNLVTFAENQLILAECGARTSGFDTGLQHLNELRAWLNTGGMLNANFANEPYMYAPFEAADFNAGGIENADGIDPTRALLREILEERYVSGFGMFIPFNDARRLRKSDTDIAVPFFMVDGPSPPYPERLPYSDDELNANENAPAEDPGIFTKTEVNK